MISNHYFIFDVSTAGTADWHYLRKFSLTSSQAHKAFVLAFPDYQTNESWIAVARYVYGDERWREKLNVVSDVGVGIGVELGAGESEDVGVEVDSEIVGEGMGVDDGGLPTIFAYLNQITIDLDDDPAVEALAFAKKFVGFRIIDDEGESSNEDSDSDDEFSLNGRGGRLIVGSEAEVKGATNKLRSSAKKNLLTLLAEHVEVQYRKGPTTS